MAGLDERFVIAGPLNQYFVDKTTALPLAGGKIFFFKDTDRTTPKPIFELTGTPPNYSFTALPNPVVLSSVGTIVNSSNTQVLPYYNPFDSDGNVELYFIVCEDANGNEQWTREAWPNITSGNNPTDLPFSIVNQMSNPQFTRTFLQESIAEVITVTAAATQEFPIAPDWSFIISGTGTVTVTQLPIAGNQNIETSPPYVLDIQVGTGITECLLRQRFDVNSGLWASTQDQDVFLAGKVLVTNNDATTLGMTVSYEPSEGGSPITIISDQFTSLAFSLLTGVTADPIPQSADTKTGANGFIDIFATIPVSSSIKISSFQIVPVFTANDDVGFDFASANRAQALMGDYFIPRLEKRREGSYLVGWDFPLNPAQFGGFATPPSSNGTITATAAYLWDQTIAVRRTADVSVIRSALTDGIEFTTSTSDEIFYVMQYLDGTQVKEMFYNRLSVNVNGFTTDESTVKGRVFLFRGKSSAAFPVLPLDLGILNFDGTFTLTETDWFDYPRGDREAPVFNLKTTDTSDDILEDVDYGFNGWQITDAADLDDTDKFAILVTFSVPVSGTKTTINSISVVPGDLPTRPSLEANEEVLDKCQFYYEKSWESPTPVATDITTAVFMQKVDITAMMSGTGIIPIDVIFSRPIHLDFLTEKRLSVPTIELFGPSGNLTNTFDAQVRATEGFHTALTQFTFTSGFDLFYVSSKRVSYLPSVGGVRNEFLTHQFSLNVSSDLANIENTISWMELHYTIDARLGVV